MNPSAVILVRFLLTGVALLLVFLAVVMWSRRREAPGANIFAALIASMAVYAFGYAGELAQTTVEGAARWLNVEYLALPWAGGLLLLGTCRHNRIHVRAWLLFIIPAITFLGYFTNFQHLFYTAPAVMVQRSPFWVMQVQRGPLSMLDNAYLLVAFLASAWIYLSALRHGSELYRKQAMVLLLSSLAPIVGYFAYLAGLSPWGLDITPIALAITGGLIYYGIFYCGVFDLAPLARTLIFNSMRDAVLILDTRDRLLDYNPAAGHIFKELSREKAGSDVGQLLAGNAELAQAVSETESPAEVTIHHADSVLNLEVRTWPLYSDSAAAEKKRLGRAVIFADVTAQVRLREELRHRSETDALTGIANRRRFHQALEVECLRYSRGRAPLSVLLIDLDYFKDVNDQYGHPAGDAVLQALAERMLLCVRKTDLLARYGGEEFAALLPETRAEGARVIAERLRAEIERKPVGVEGVAIPITVSIGIACHIRDEDVDPGVLLKKADLALYQAKASGRNCAKMA
jgi:diguanylate cyclase (GGDEF)-like protein